jgi:hypothetical protein
MHLQFLKLLCNLMASSVISRIRLSVLQVLLSVQLDVICMFCHHNCRPRFETSLQIFNFVNISANNCNAMFVFKSNQKFTQSLVSVTLMCYELNIALNLKSNGRLVIGGKQSDRNVLDFFVKPSDISSPFLREGDRLKSHWILATTYLFIFIVINSVLFP